MKGKKDYPAFDMNPSVALIHDVHYHEEVSRESVEPVMITSTDTGEEKSGLIFTGKKRIFLQDMMQFNKFWIGIRFADINKEGLQLLDYIAASLQKNQQELNLEEKTCMKECGWTSYTSFYRAIISLLENEIIFKSSAHPRVYYLNINKVHNGDRRVHFRKYQLKAKTDPELKERMQRTIELYNQSKQ